MGRFQTAAEFYRYREPYPAEFFASVAKTLGLTRQTRMLDVGCGPGNLAIGFAPLVGPCRAIDLEPEMLRMARMAAAELGIGIEFEQMAIEELAASDGAFDFVTIGRALHWLAHEATLAVFERAMAEGGRIAVCVSTSMDAPWEHKYKEIRRAWSSDPNESRYRPDLDQWFAVSRFRRLDEISIVVERRVTVDELVGRALSFSITSPAVLGERRPEFERELRTALDEFATQGSIEEQVMAKASIIG
jgi:SAM-dependent methyltransferase